MLKKEERTVKELYTAEVICNKCGRSLNPEKEDYIPVSYTHLDVYKSQAFGFTGTPIHFVVRERKENS